MKRLIAGLAAALLVVGVGWTRGENAISDRYGNKGGLVTYDGPSGPETRRQDGNASGHTIVDAAGNTFTVAGPQLQGIWDESVTIKENTQGTWDEAQTVKTNTGLIATSTDRIDAGVTTSNTSLDRLDGGVTTANAHLTVIEEKAVTMLTKMTSLDDKAVTMDTGNIAGSVNLTAPATIGSVPGTLDSNNSSTANLGIGATFTGTATDVSDYSHITVFALADEDSAASGLTIEFSPDGTTWAASGSTKHQFTVDADTSRSFQLGPEAQFMRVVYVNGGTAQTSFDLETRFRPNNSHTTLHRVGDTVTEDRSVKLRKSILVAQKPDTSFTNIDATAGGNLKSSVEEFDGALLGQKTMANSLAVVFPSDQSAMTVIFEPNLTDHETKVAKYTTTQAATSLWTPAGGKKIVLYGIWASSDTAGSQLEVDGSTFGSVVPTAYITKDGGFVIPMGMAPIWIGIADETLDITTSAGDPDVSVILIGYER